MGKDKKYGAPEFFDLLKKEGDLYSKKNYDYAFGGDFNGNFTRMASLLSNYPGLDLSKREVVAAVQMLKQMDAALWMMNSGYEGGVEDVDTRMRDVAVFAKIIQMLHKEDSSKEKGGETR